MEDVERYVDCERGRHMGCGTFCCRLLVRLEPDEPHPTHPGGGRRCIDKDPTSGACVHLDKQTHACGIWAIRPRICRAYDCNEDPSLQVVLREGFRSLLHLAFAEGPPRETWVRIPTRTRPR